MRKFGIVKTTTLQTNATQIVGPSEKRQALYFSPPQGANEYTVSTEASVKFGGGINLSAASGGFSWGGRGFDWCPGSWSRRRLVAPVACRGEGRLRACPVCPVQFDPAGGRALGCERA